MFKKLILLCLTLSLLLTCAAPAMAVDPVEYYTAHSVEELVHWINTAEANEGEEWEAWYPFLHTARKHSELLVAASTAEGYTLEEILVPAGQDNMQFFFKKDNSKFLVYIELPGTEDNPKPSLPERIANINRELALAYEDVQFTPIPDPFTGEATDTYYHDGGEYRIKDSDETELIAPTAYSDWLGYTIMRQGVGDLYGSKWDHAYFNLFRFETVTLSEHQRNNPFADVTENDWFYDEVQYVYEKGLMNGVASDRFAPQDNVSRAMAATVLYRLAGEPEAKGSNPFTDVEENQWYSDAIIWAAGEKIIEGYGDGTFGTNDPVTREQLVTLFWRYQGSLAVEADALAAFSDAVEISTWAEDAFAWAVSTGLIQGKPGAILDPKGTTTRAELAQILMNYDLMKIETA